MSDHHRAVVNTGSSQILSSQARRVLATIGAAVVLQVAIISAFCGVLTHATVHDAVVDVVGTTDGAPAVAGVTYRPVASAAQARDDVAHLSASAALDVSGTRTVVWTASAGSAQLAQALSTSLVTALPPAPAPSVVDLKPLPAADHNGVASYFLVIGWNIGAYLGAVLLVRVTGGLAGGVRRAGKMLALLAGYAVASAAAGAAVVDAGLGVLTGSPFALFGVGVLAVFAVSCYAAGLVSLLGTFGIVVAVGTLVVLGSPTAGGSVPPQMMPGGWHFLSQVLPVQHVVDLLRRTVYFDGTGVADSVLVLSIYAAAGALVVLVNAHRRRPRHEITETDLETLEGAELAAVGAAGA